MNVMKVSKLYFSNSKRPQKNKRGKRSEPASVLLHQTGSCDLTIACVTLLKIIVHSQPVNPPDAAQTHDVEYLPLRRKLQYQLLPVLPLFSVSNQFI
jgi:hypothetical protein